MIRKEIPVPSRRRGVPEGFGWVDHRLAREGYFGRCRPESLSLYLFLVTVADADGVSWYSDRRLCKDLNLAPGVMEAGRRELVRLGLVAHQPPFHQVLELPRPGVERGFRELAGQAFPSPEGERPGGIVRPAARPAEPEEPEEPEELEVLAAVPGYPPWFRSPYRREEDGGAVAIGEVVEKIINGGRK